jgi:hypothetical protein
VGVFGFTGLNILKHLKIWIKKKTSEYYESLVGQPATHKAFLLLQHSYAAIHLSHARNNTPAVEVVGYADDQLIIACFEGDIE